MDFKTKIIENTIIEVANSSFGKFSTLEIAKRSGCSEANLFKLFKTKRNLLLEAYLYIDAQIEKKIKIKVPEQIETYDDYMNVLKELVECVVSYLSKKKEYTIYYAWFRTSSLYNSMIFSYESRIRNDLFDFFQNANQMFNIYSEVGNETFWLMLFDYVLCIVRRDVEQYINLPRKEANRTTKYLIDQMFKSLENKVSL